MRTVSAKEMGRAEASAYASGSSDAEFMEAAGRGIADEVEQFVQERDMQWSATLLCGSGNNAGDAYVAGCYLLEIGYRVEALQLAPIEKCSPLCQKNHRRFLEYGGEVRQIAVEDEIYFWEESILLDGIFGTGFHGKAEGLIAKAIHVANRSGLPILAIDIPSGVNGNTGRVDGEAIVADRTLFLGLPKSGFFIGDAWNHVGELLPIDFGIEQRFLDDAHADFEMVTEEWAAALLPPIVRNRNKYMAGSVAGWAGSPSMPGAAILSSFAALRGGAGLVRLYHPAGMEAALAAAPPEVIRVGYENATDLADELNGARAVYVGPGLGRDCELADQLKAVVPKIDRPCLLDADALTVLSEGEWWAPKGCLLTPHTGEFARLVYRSNNPPKGEELIDVARAFADEREVVVLLKGGPSFVFAPGRIPVAIPVGTPGMATAGSGDVLTGVVAALLAQGLQPREAAILGAYLHGKAGEAAANLLTPYAMVASDITAALPAAFEQLLSHY